jgi:hypothetical protein
MADNRKDIRYQTLASARMEGVTEGEIIVKDLSITGCCVECTVHGDFKPNCQHTIVIIPETAANIGSFDLPVETKWVRSSNYSCEIGLSIVESPRGKSFQRYVDYLSWRSSAGLNSTQAV